MPTIEQEMNDSLLNTTRIKIFSSENKRADILEDKINNWLSKAHNIEIVNILTTSNSFATEDFTAEELYLIVVYKKT